MTKINKDNVIWTPQPKQIEFMRRPEFECLYGGAAGGGKSDALVAEALRQVEIPHYKGLILRRTYPQLSELIDKSRLLYPRAVPGARYNSTEHTWHFPSGAKVVFGSMNRKADRINYQGKAYDFIGFDELTHFDHDEYTYLYSRARPNGPGTRVYVRATTNPGGKGHGWVKDRFITAAPPLTPIPEEVQIDGPDGLIVVKRKRIFVPATVFDNKQLLANDPGYIATLGMMPEAEKKALLYGDWDSFNGQVFTEWKNNPNGALSQTWSHVIEPFKIPANWNIYRGFDWGYSRPFSVGWYAIAPSGRMYRFRELYGCTGEPNKGVQWTTQRLAEEIAKIEREDENIKGRYVTGIADPAIFAEDGGESIAEAMERCGVYFGKADHERIAGKMQCHYRLAFDEEGRPMFYVFNTCKHFIRCIPSLVYSETNVEDVDSDQEDHNYDEWRYVCMSRPIAPRENYGAKQIVDYKNMDDPLNMLADKYGRR